jgi:hypothetical protein
MLRLGLSAPVGEVRVWRVGAWIPQIIKGMNRHRRISVAIRTLSLLYRIVSRLVSVELNPSLSLAFMRHFNALLMYFILVVIDLLFLFPSIPPKLCHADKTYRWLP